MSDQEPSPDRAGSVSIIALVASMLRKAMVKTIPEFFRRRYDRHSALFTSIIMTLPLIGLTAVQFIASRVIKRQWLLLLLW